MRHTQNSIRVIAKSANALNGTPIAAIAIEAREIFRLILNIDQLRDDDVFLKFHADQRNLDRNLT
jgi:hypothetical protein